jgi:diazepam-binding inhibitor (GABA receptor modulating acyl-CoA-binding protein)
MHRQFRYLADCSVFASRVKVAQKHRCRENAPQMNGSTAGEIMAAAPKDLKTKFEAATTAAKHAKKKPDNATLLKLYSYYKQSTDGDVKGDRPGGFDFVGAAKFDAWTKLKGMSKDDAMQNYIKQVEKLNRD